MGEPSDACLAAGFGGDSQWLISREELLRLQRIWFVECYGETITLERIILQDHPDRTLEVNDKARALLKHALQVIGQAKRANDPLTNGELIIGAAAVARRARKLIRLSAASS
jgi:hypothetical protein